MHTLTSIAQVDPNELLPAAEALSFWWALAVIAAGTLVSEDLTCITSGLLIRDGRLSVLTGLAGCLLGIYVGDLGLWLLGRLFGKGLLRWRWLRHRLPARRLERLGPWLDRRGWAALLAARFLPGTRLPLYLTAGAGGQTFAAFALWTGLAALLWTPLVVLSVALFGEAVVRPFLDVFGPGWLALLSAVTAVFLTLRTAVLLCSATGRARLIAGVSRLWRWEFWPVRIFYAPWMPWVGLLALRYRSLTVWTAANPGIPLGGVVGESKYAILAQLPQDAVVPTLLVPPGAWEERLGRLEQEIHERGWQFPLILKPDVGQRGAGLKLARDPVDVAKYLQSQPAAVLVQTYHPGPYEAGIFYYRIPGEPAGKIFSITDKVFPEVVGDGRSTLEELIWRHPRYRMQARRFLTRHAADADRILEAGERFVLATAGNHCQGTMFRDGAHLLTPELERAVDAVVQKFHGFFIGRMDVRYSDLATFRAGGALAVVELNGATSESTNLYDPSWSLPAAYRTLFRQWALLFRIGDANRRQGHEVTGAWTFLRTVLDYYRSPRPNPVAD
jgi:membrane protein DedA with SNARE-associated domain